jgi:hypothetical protein
LIQLREKKYLNTTIIKTKISFIKYKSMSKEFKIAKPLTLSSAIAARISLALAIFYAALLLSLHFIKPELDPRWNFISEYALGENGWIMTLTFIALAGSLASLFFAIRSQVKTVAGYIGLVLLLLAVTGMTIAAINPMDPMTTAPENATASGKMHELGATLDWTPVAALLISFSLIRIHTWIPIRRKLFIASSVCLFMTLAFIAVIAAAGGKPGPGVYAGLIGRLLILSYVGWIAVVALQTIKLYKISNAAG